MKQKSTVYMIIVGLSLLAGSAVFSLFQNKPLLNVFANNEQTYCSLPTGYYEIDDVLTQAIANDDTLYQNNRPFRGTVTAIDGQFAYVQRRNPNTGRVEGIRINNVDVFAPDLRVNNVVNFHGGYLFSYFGQPTLALYDYNQYTIVDNDNLYGFYPTVYSNLDDYYTNGFKYGKDVDPGYDASQLITINSLRIDYLNDVFSSSNVLDGNKIIYATAYYNSQHINLYIHTPYEYSYEVYENTFEYYDWDSYKYWGDLMYAYANGLSINVTGFLNVNNSFGLGIHVATGNSIEINYDYDKNTFRKQETYNTFFDIDRYAGSFVSSLYYPINSEIPYVRFDEYYNDIFLPIFIGNNNEAMAFDGSSGFVTNYVSVNGSNRVTLSTLDNTISMVSADNLPVDYFWSFGPLGQHYLVNGIETAFCQIDWANSRVLNPTILSKTFDLDLYNIDIISDSSGDAYIPYSIADSLLVGVNGYSFAFNGKDAYFSASISSDYYPFLIKYFLDTSWYSPGTMGSQDYCDFAYNAFCFTLDNCYGLNASRYNGNADAFINSVGLKSALKSTDCQVYEDAFQKFAALYFYDGHAGYQYRSPKTDNTTVSKSYGEWINNNPRRIQLVNTYYELQSYREAAGYGVGLRIHNNMAVITFDSFVKYRGDSTAYDYSKSYNLVHNDGSDLLFRKAFAEIDAHGGIDYVVIDDAMNGGGMVDSIPFLLSYMTLDPALTNYNSLTGEVVDIHYDVDLNQNGIFNEDTDTYAGRYQFFLLTSNYSFSCGNILPTIVKANNLATIIGQTSGGGECIVGYLSTPHGATLRNSSNIHGGHWDEVNDVFVGNEGGIAVDYELDYQYFYNDVELLSFIESIA